MNRRNHLQSNSHCQECGSSQSECWTLHNLRLRASFSRLCTHCVLKNNLSLFCPVCFDVYDPSPPPSDQRVLCFQCPSISHLSCVSFPLSSAFLCPLCSDPYFTFFKSSDLVDVRESDSAIAQNENVTDIKSAKAVVAAARVAAQSMWKAAADARFDAERKMQVAAFAKKQAELALERLSHLVLQEKERDANTKANEDAVAGARTVGPPQPKNKGETAILNRKKRNQSL